MMQELVVFAIVTVAACSVGWRYLPAGAKKRVASGLAALFGRLGWQGLAARFAGSAEKAGCGDGCGTCGGCGSGEKLPASSEFAITPETLRRSTRR